MTTNSTICPWELKIIEITAYFILMTLSLAGNLFIVAVFYKNKGFRTPVHCFIANTAVSDLMVPMIFLPARISELYNDKQWLEDGVLGNIVCKLVDTAPHLSVFVSMLNMATIAVDRFYAVVYPMKTALVSKKNCFRLIIMSWIVPVVSQSYQFYALRIKERQNTIRCINVDPDARVVYDNLLLFLFIFTAVFLTGMYSTIIIFLYRQQSRLQLASEATKRRAKENRKVTTMLIFLVIPFLFLWVPSFVYNCHPTSNCLLSWAVCFLPLWYTVVNPVVLFVFRKTFRQGCKEIIYSFSVLKCFKKRNMCSSESV